MSSILTNSSAMVALETLRGINRGLNEVQSQISTGKKVANAKDSASIFAISTVMQADVASFKQISDSLNLGSSTVGVARAAAENVTSLLQDMKELIVSAQEENVDRSKIQTDVDELVTQINSVVNAAQFNGQNLLQGGGNIQILSSLDRDSTQNVSTSSISVNRQNLESANATVAGTTIAGAGAITALSAQAVADGAAQTVTLTQGTLVASNTAGATSGYSVQIGTETVSFAAREGDTQNDVARNLKNSIDALGLTGITVDLTEVADPTSTDVTFTINNDSGGGITVTTVSGDASTAGGGLAGLADIDVETSTATANQALADIEGLLQTAIDSASAFGSSQKRIDNQIEFVSQLTDSLTDGIGALVDADIEEASARLQSLQVQQQLGIQALSIANQQPAQLLALFN
ncbi:flagellin [Parvularcula sp. IMCC14364]|uniref:flagellin n=1 Tax=Parvularcula sp. IMCC14364 TaxID=3067902 RepID=UPI00274049DE|nr:flagellin [Parvularcula sp. IMCC14364]